jgi:hypothetical protein
LYSVSCFFKAFIAINANISASSDCSLIVQTISANLAAVVVAAASVASASAAVVVGASVSAAAIVITPSTTVTAPFSLGRALC